MFRFLLYVKQNLLIMKIKTLYLRIYGWMDRQTDQQTFGWDNFFCCRKHLKQKFVFVLVGKCVPSFLGFHAASKRLSNV